jgi:hypothetical protein
VIRMKFSSDVRDRAGSGMRGKRIVQLGRDDGYLRTGAQQQIDLPRGDIAAADDQDRLPCQSDEDRKIVHKPKAN